ncbi:hypothetical protein [Candidatus Palauibacter sp.]|uniref:hypothetical protein n=1 Tax=Candidatus Palauibacter sp. TaxID=3101350 RepID=UPI003B52D39E
MRRAALAALAAVLWFAAPASAQEYVDDTQGVCYPNETARQCADRHFTDLDPLLGEDLDVWRGKFERATWTAGTNCEKVKTALFEAFDMTESAVDGVREFIYLGKPKDSGLGGAHYPGAKDSTEHMFVVNKDQTPEAQWRSFLHEAGHHGGLSGAHTESFDAYDAEECATEPEEDPNGGGGGTEDPGVDDPTCTTTIEWKKAYRFCTYWTGPSGLPDLHVCIEVIWIPVEVTICTS